MTDINGLHYTIIVFGIFFFVGAIKNGALARMRARAIKRSSINERI